MKNLLLVFFVSTQLLAGVIEFSGPAKMVSVSGIVAKVFPEATIKTGENDIKLKLSGSGVRAKEVFFVNVNVYLAASYLDDLSFVKAEKPLESIKNTKARIMQLTLLRNLSGVELCAAFQEALTVKGNDVDINSAAFQNLFNQFNFDLNKGQTATIAMYNKGGDIERVVVEVPEKSFAEEAKFFGFDLWKTWFGVPVDAGMKTLQSKLLSNN